MQFKEKKRDSELRYTWQVLGGPRENNQDRKKGIEIQTDKLGYLDELTQFKRMYVTNIMTHVLR